SERAYCYRLAEDRSRHSVVGHLDLATTTRVFLRDFSQVEKYCLAAFCRLPRRVRDDPEHLSNEVLLQCRTDVVGDGDRRSFRDPPHIVMRVDMDENLLFHAGSLPDRQGGIMVFDKGDSARGAGIFWDC